MSYMILEFALEYKNNLKFKVKSYFDFLQFKSKNGNV
jgi:hypothetical protein